MSSMSALLGLDDESDQLLQQMIEARERACASKEKHLKRMEDTGYSRFKYQDWGMPELIVRRVTKKDGSVSVGALLGVANVTHVSLGQDPITASPDYQPQGNRGILDTDDLWCDGAVDHSAVKVPMPDAMRFIGDTRDEYVRAHQYVKDSRYFQRLIKSALHR